MPANLPDSISHALTPDLVEKSASALGESPIATGRAVSAAVPTILGGLVQGTGDENLMSQVLAILKSPANDGEALRNPDSLLDAVTGPARGVVSLGKTFLGTLFGERLATMTDTISRYAGVRGDSAGSLLGMVAPLVLAVLGDRVSRDNLDIGGLTRFLASQKDAVMSAMPGPVASAFGLTPIGDVSRPAPAVGATSPRGSFNWTWPLVGAAALAGIWLFSRAGNDRVIDTAMGTVDSMAASAAATATGAASSAANWVKHALPGGVELNAPPDGIEHRIVRFIEDPGTEASDTTWFDFDRLNFETGSSTLRPGSREQLQNVASILQAYPKVEVRIGGYTDNTGDAAANVKLSQDRADAVRRELEVLGISPTRLAAEGYGAQHPVADNTTEEGRARNRRIALRVTKK
jgi:outer membrane protein OmpA-like peptidoglycan-associated protein